MRQRPARKIALITAGRALGVAVAGQGVLPLVDQLDGLAGSTNRPSLVLMVIWWRMFDRPRDADKEHQQHEDDEDPELDGGILAPLDSSYALA